MQVTPLSVHDAGENRAQHNHVRARSEWGAKSSPRTNSQCFIAIRSSRRYIPIRWGLIAEILPYLHEVPWASQLKADGITCGNALVGVSFIIAALRPVSGVS